MRSTYHPEWEHWRHKLRLFSPRVRIYHRVAGDRLDRGVRQVPGTFSCEHRISAPLVVMNEWAYRFRRVARMNKAK